MQIDDETVLNRQFRKRIAYDRVKARKRITFAIKCGKKDWNIKCE